ncbi:MAG: hypothetical protein ACK5XN_02690 [Bacteroidota bacterium]
MRKKIKLILVGIAGLIFLFTIIGLLIPSSVKISRGIIVNRDSATVAKLVGDVKSWPEWMIWLRSGEGSFVKFSNEGTVSAVKWYTFNPKGSGEIELLGKGDELFRLRHHFPGLNVAEGGIRLRSVSTTQTEILWMLEYPLKWYPWERFEGIFLDGILGQSLEASLQLIKEKLLFVSSEAI